MNDPYMAPRNDFLAHEQKAALMAPQELTGTECLRVDGWSSYFSRVLLDDPARLAALAGLD